MKIKDIPSNTGQLIFVVIETPGGTPYKYDYDIDFDLFRMNKILPLGMVFPFDFGFVPSTKAEDGDPLDVLAGKEFIPLGWQDGQKAFDLIKKYAK